MTERRVLPRPAHPVARRQILPQTADLPSVQGQMETTGWIFRITKLRKPVHGDLSVLMTNLYLWVNEMQNYFFVLLIRRKLLL